MLVLCLGSSAICFAQDDEENQSGDAVALFVSGQDAHEKGELAAALQFYEKALAIVPEFPEAEYQRANAFLSLGRADEAEKSFRHAVELRSDWTLALAGLGSVLVTREKFTEAEPILLKAIALDELNFPAYSALTELRLRTKAQSAVLKELLNTLKRLTSKAKPTASIWAARAALEKSLGDKASARVSFGKALELEPKNQFALFENAILALDESDATRAGEIARILEKIVPKSTNTKILRARILIASGQQDEALKILGTIDNPGTDAAELRKSIIASRTVSAAELEKQLESDPKNVTILGRLCSLRRVDNPTAALSYCRLASEAEPDNITHAIGYGAALVQAKMFIEAVALFRKIFELAPDNSTARANLATALFKLKRFTEAKIEYRWLIEKQPSLTAAYYFLAITHDQLGEYLDAMANYQQFIRIADQEKNKLEIEKVNLRLPGLQSLIKNGKGKRDGRQK